MEHLKDIKLVAKGFTQRKIFDYRETFLLVAKIVSVWLLYFEGGC